MSRLILVLIISLCFINAVHANFYLQPDDLCTESTGPCEGSTPTGLTSCFDGAVTIVHTNGTTQNQQGICAVWPKMDISRTCSAEGLCYRDNNLNISIYGPTSSQLSNATTVFLVPGGHCVTDSISNNTYCPKWPDMKVNVSLLPGEVYTNTDLNITVKRGSLSDVYYNMTVNSSLIVSDINLTVDCAIGGLDVRNASMDMPPGSSWFNIQCLPFVDPIKGIIDINESTTFDETWNFTSEGASCLINVNPNDLFMTNLNFANKYSVCTVYSQQLQDELNSVTSTKDKYSIMLILIILSAGFFALMWLKDIKGGQLIKNPITSKINLKDSSDKSVDLDVPKRDKNYFMKKYGLGGRK